MAEMGDVSMVRNAADVVMDVRKIGSNSWFIVRVRASFTFLCVRASLKNRDIICTPSELAIVKRTIGIELLTNVKIKRSEPVK